MVPFFTILLFSRRFLCCYGDLQIYSSRLSTSDYFRALKKLLCEALIFFNISLYAHSITSTCRSFSSSVSVGLLLRFEMFSTLSSTTGIMCILICGDHLLRWKTVVGKNPLECTGHRLTRNRSRSYICFWRNPSLSPTRFLSEPGIANKLFLSATAVILSPLTLYLSIWLRRSLLSFWV